MAVADLLALISKGESFGIVAVEAMRAGVPVLLSDRVGICREVAEDGAGMVVLREVEAVAQALIHIFSDKEGLEVMGQMAAAAARKRYDNEQVSRLMEIAFKDVLSGRRSPELFWSHGASSGDLTNIIPRG